MPIPLGTFYGQDGSPEELGRMPFGARNGLYFLSIAVFQENNVPLASSTTATPQPTSQVVQRLQDVRTIYVVPMNGNNADVAEMVSAKLISHLAKKGRGRVAIVESAEKADAILLVTYMLNA